MLMRGEISSDQIEEMPSKNYEDDSEESDDDEDDEDDDDDDDDNAIVEVI